MTGRTGQIGHSPAAKAGSSVRFAAVSKHYGDFVAVHPVDIDVEPGEFLSFLGPSGSGKTTTLMMLAGFETPSSGDIYIGDDRITNMLPAKRNIGMVFQSYALFPHMTVEQNVSFPLRMRNVPKAERTRAVGRVLEIVGLNGLGNRFPRQLSGGQQQRVALARAIVFEPPVLLMDEPLSALDKYLRSHLQGEIKRIQRELGITVIYVTHDQDEAMTMSDRICVMNEGRIRQIGSPETLYRKPEDVFVAGFLGESNMLTAQDPQFEGETLAITLAGDKVNVPARRAPSSQVVVAVRPEHLAVTPATDGTARIADVTYVGDHRRYEVLTATGEKLAVKSQIVDESEPIGVGEAVKVAWPVHQMRVFSDGASLQ